MGELSAFGVSDGCSVLVFGGIAVGSQRSMVGCELMDSGGWLWMTRGCLIS